MAIVAVSCKAERGREGRWGKNFRFLGKFPHLIEIFSKKVHFFREIDPSAAGWRRFRGEIAKTGDWRVQTPDPL